MESTTFRIQRISTWRARKENANVSSLSTFLCGGAMISSVWDVNIVIQNTQSKLENASTKAARSVKGFAPPGPVVAVSSTHSTI